MKKISFVIAFLCACNAVAQTAEVKKIDSLLSYYESKNEFMGSVALSENGKVIFEKAYGFSDVFKNKKADKNTKYKIGSITKMFTASVIFQLMEEGKLTLDTKLSQFYPDVPNATIITIGNLLNHQSGIFNYTNDSQFSEFFKTTHNKKMLVDKITSYPSAFAPGSKSEYSNSNYILLGFIIEDLTKKSYEKNITDRIIKKLNLKNTSYGGVTNTANNEALSYKWENQTWNVETPWDMSLAGSAGAILSTPGELNVFIKALFDGKIIKQTSLTEMTKIEDGYGKGIFQVPFGAKKGFGHTGGIEEFRSMLGYFPNEKVALAICGNGKGENNNDIAIGMLSIHFGEKFEFPNLDKRKIDPTILAKYEGVYAAAGLPLKLTIKRDGDFLTAQGTGQPSFPLDAQNETDFSFKPAGLEIHFAENKLLLKQGGGEYEMIKE